MDKAEYKYDPAKMEFHRRLDGKEELLGRINTHKAKLTQGQKLKIIRANGEWVSF